MMAAALPSALYLFDALVNIFFILKRLISGFSKLHTSYEL